MPRTQSRPPGAPRSRPPADRHAQGAVDADQRRARAARGSSSAPHVPRAHRPSRGGRSARRRRRCSPRRAPGTSGRPCSARPTAAARGRRPRSRRRSRRTAGASSTTRSGSRPGTRRSRACGTRGTSPQGLFRRRTAARRGKASIGFNAASASARRGAAATRTARPTGPSCIRSSSIRAIPTHLYIAMSSGGVFESTDAGADWQPLNQRRARRFPAEARSRVRPRSALRALRRRQPRPPLSAEPLRHLSGSTVRRRAGSDIGDNMPKSVGDVGLPMVAHPHDPESAVGVPDGRHRRLAAHLARRASPPRTARATAARRGSGRPTACRSRRRGGP